MKKPRRIVIAGAAGRDFHDFNVCFRDDRDVEVVAFTATQIPHIEERTYPPELAGPGYPRGIPIHSEELLERLIVEYGADEVVFAYSDVSNGHVMSLASRALAADASFRFLSPAETMLSARKPVVAVTAGRTGSGKSPFTRALVRALTARNLRVAVVRHPMPYGDLAAQAVQRFSSLEDLDRYHCTIEEREEYERHIESGSVVFAGVDYARILEQAEAEADVIVWDGGNNDFPFFEPALWFALVDAHRPGDEVRYWPGAVNVRRADVVVVSKCDTATQAQIQRARRSAAQLNPHALITYAASPMGVEDVSLIHDKRVLVIEDGPTTTHGGMPFGAGMLAARRYGAREIIDPRPHAVGEIAETLRRYPHIETFLPAMGYGDTQLRDLATTIRRADPDTVVVGTPVDLSRVIELDRPTVAVRYETRLIGEPTLSQLLDPLLEELPGLQPRAASYPERPRRSRS